MQEIWVEFRTLHWWFPQGVRVHSKSIQFWAPCKPYVSYDLCSVLNFKPWLELTLLLLSRLLHHNNLHLESLVVMLVADSLQISRALVERMLADDVTELNWPECFFYSRDYWFIFLNQQGIVWLVPTMPYALFYQSSLCVCLCGGPSPYPRDLFPCLSAFLFLWFLVICGVSCPWRQF